MVVRQKRRLRPLESARPAFLEHGRKDTGARRQRALGQILRRARQFLQLQLLAAAIEPQQGTRLKSERVPQKLDGMKELLMNGLDRSLRQLLFFLGTRAQAAGDAQPRRDQAKITGFFAHRKNFFFQAFAVLAPLARHLGVQESDVEDSEHDNEPGMAGECRSRLRCRTGAERQHTFESKCRQREQCSGLERMERHQEADQRVDQRVNRRLTAAQH